MTNTVPVAQAKNYYPGFLQRSTVFDVYPWPHLPIKKSRKPYVLQDMIVNMNAPNSHFPYR